MVKFPSVIELAKAGVHLGHKGAKLAPKMEPYIYGAKNTVDLIDLDKTLDKLQAALKFITEVVSQGKVVLFLGTKPPAKDIIKKYAQKVNMPFAAERWLAGTLTNFSTISKLIKKLKKMEEEKKAEGWAKYTKKEQLGLERELTRLGIMAGGIKALTKKPDILYIVDIKKEKTALRETIRCKIPVVAMIDTNANPEMVNWPIPANDDAIKSIELITRLVAEAIEEGQKKQGKEEIKEKKEKTEKKEKNKGKQ